MNSFTCLGLVSTATGRCFAESQKGNGCCCCNQKSTKKIFIETACKLFSLKLVPTAMYEIPFLWKRLSIRNLPILDGRKLASLKLLLSLYATTGHRLICLLKRPSNVDQRCAKALQPYGSIRYIYTDSNELNPESLLISPKIYTIPKQVSRNNRYKMIRLAVQASHRITCQT